MKKNGKYRFTLQFPAETEEQITAGELLEKLGNKKSAVVVQALYDFAVTHQDVFRQKGKIAIRTTQSPTMEQLESLIKKLLDRQSKNDEMQSEVQFNESANESIVSKMLDNLDVFQ